MRKKASMSRSRHGRKCRAQIKVDGRTIIVGTYATPEAAALAYDQAARLHRGEFAGTNEMAGLPGKTQKPVQSLPLHVMAAPGSSRGVTHTSTLAVSALAWMNSRRGSTRSPISSAKMLSA